MSPFRAVVRRAAAQQRVMTASFAAGFAVYTAANVIGYRRSYPTASDRIGLATSFGTNSSLRLFYGIPHDLLSTSGYVEWRVGGFLALVAGVFGAVASVRALRSEEESGRLEAVVSGLMTRPGAFAAAATAVAAGVAVVAIVMLITLLATSMPAAGSLWLGLDLALTACAFAGVGAVASQVMPTRRGAYTASTLALAAAFMGRVAADTSSSVDGLRWATPLGWAEEVRPFTGARPVVLLAPAATAAILTVAAAVIAGGRDVGAALLAPRDTAPPNLRLLGSPARWAARDEAAVIAIWLAGTGIFAFVVGSLSGSIAGALSAELRRRLQQLGAGDIATPNGFLAFYFVFFVLAVSLFACAQVGAARREEAEGRLETLAALPVGRVHWLASRLALAGTSALALALTAGVAAWAGARVNGIHVGLWGAVEAGLNILPTGILFLGVATLLLGTLPRAGTGLAYAVVAIAFLWELVGSVVSAPHWLLQVTPFHHVGLVPIRPYPAVAATVMTAIGVAAALLGTAAFTRRDLTSA